MLSKQIVCTHFKRWTKNQEDRECCKFTVSHFVDGDGNVFLGREDGDREKVWFWAQRLPIYWRGTWMGLERFEPLPTGCIGTSGCIRLSWYVVRVRERATSFSIILTILSNNKYNTYIFIFQVSGRNLIVLELPNVERSWRVVRKWWQFYCRTISPAWAKKNYKPSWLKSRANEQRRQQRAATKQHRRRLHRTQQSRVTIEWFWTDTNHGLRARMLALRNWRKKLRNWRKRWTSYWRESMEEMNGLMKRMNDSGQIV